MTRYIAWIRREVEGAPDTYITPECSSRDEAVREAFTAVPNALEAQSRAVERQGGHTVANPASHEEHHRADFMGQEELLKLVVETAEALAGLECRLFGEVRQQIHDRWLQCDVWRIVLLDCMPHATVARRIVESCFEFKRMVSTR